MAVHYPSNVDDHIITAKFDPDGAPYELSCLAPTTMSASIARIRLAEICEEAVNQFPFNGFDSSEPDYDTILALDAMFQDYLENLPSFFQLQPGIVQDTQFSSQGHPYLSWQRLILHFSAHTRLCWLHRHFHLKSSVNNRYKYSREAGIRSARMVLELRGLMDDAGRLVSINPSRLWSIMQHVFHAAILLASDFSLYPTGPDAATRLHEVLAACRTLEQSAPDVDGTHRVVQKLRATLKERRPKNIPPATIDPASLISRDCMPGGSISTEVNSTMLQVKTEPSSVWSNNEELSPSPLDILGLGLADAAPEMDLDLWASLSDLTAEPLGGISGGFEQNG